VITNLRELFHYRSLIWALTSRELRARYRNSFLGFLWTFMNPLFLMGVYSLMFTVFMPQQISHYTYFMFVGLLPWLFFSNSVGAGAASLSSKRDLLTRVRFPPQILPTVTVLSELGNYLFALPIMAALGYLSGLPLRLTAVAFPLILVLQLVFTLGLVTLASALNVFFRDIQHVLTNLLTLWFFLVPVVYPASTVPVAFRGLMINSDPMAVFVTSYQRIFYYGTWPDFRALATSGVASLILWMAAVVIFEGRRDEFAEMV
jgi:lipopolysaccharide transport system permease protein